MTFVTKYSFTDQRLAQVTLLFSLVLEEEKNSSKLLSLNCCLHCLSDFQIQPDLQKDTLKWTVILNIRWQLFSNKPKNVCSDHFFEELIEHTKLHPCNSTFPHIYKPWVTNQDESTGRERKQIQIICKNLHKHVLCICNVHLQTRCRSNFWSLEISRITLLREVSPHDWLHSAKKYFC